MGKKEEARGPLPKGWHGHLARQQSRCWRSHVGREGKPAGFLLPLHLPLPDLCFPASPAPGNPWATRQKGACGLGGEWQPWVSSRLPVGAGCRAVGSAAHPLAVISKHVPYKPDCWDMSSWKCVSPPSQLHRSGGGGERQTDRQSPIKPSPGRPLTLPPAFSSLWLQHSKSSIKSSDFTGS